MANADYLFDQAWAQERRRLDALGALYDRFTIEHLTRAGTAAGWSCLEVGAGSGTIARWMASQVGRDGRVLATDIDPRFLEPLAGRGVEVRRHDIAADDLEERAFDLVHARAVLQHVPGRERALAKMAAALRPGQVLLVEDIVMPHPATHPSLPAWGRILEAMTAGLRGAGANPFYGLELPSAFAALGLTDVRCEARVAVMQSGTPSIDFVALSIEQVQSRLIAAGVVSEREVSEVLAAFRTPGLTMTGAIMIAVSGRV
jgi:SAM-dependent methyltransferase